MIRLRFGRKLVYTLTVAAIMAATTAAAQETTLREWFNKLQSPAGGLCCHNFDGISLEEENWRTANGQYEVFVFGAWIKVPDQNLVTYPDNNGNRLGRAHLWLRGDGSVRCFMPGSLG